MLTIDWSSPAPITAGTPLSSIQQDATAPVPGAFVHAPAAGNFLAAGVVQNLSLTFTPRTPSIASRRQRRRQSTASWHQARGLGPHRGHPPEPVAPPRPTAAARAAAWAVSASRLSGLPCSGSVACVAVAIAGRIQSRINQLESGRAPKPCGARCRGHVESLICERTLVSLTTILSRRYGPAAWCDPLASPARACRPSTSSALAPHHGTPGRVCGRGRDQVELG